MTRSLSIILFAAVAAVALLASQTVDAQASKPQCAPIHTLYKTFTNPLAQAAEKCVLTGVAQSPSITSGGLDSLCKTFPGYIPAEKQTAPAELAPAVASASSLAAAMPTATADGGGDGTSGGSGSGKSGTSGAYRMADGSSSVVMIGMTAFAAVVLATAAAF
ncbi:hypothetical protein BGZ89_006830 [Linnemannia elongata]|nr:hypothetical protein BGZ89_006830 [Linnemannia elongata]